MTGTHLHQIMDSLWYSCVHREILLAKTRIVTRFMEHISCTPGTVTKRSCDFNFEKG